MSPADHLLVGVSLSQPTPTTTNMKNIDELRHDTPGCHQLIHLNNAGASLMPLPVINAIHNYIADETYHGGYETADAQAAKMDEFYSLAAAVLDTNPRNIAFTSSATDGYNRALSCIPFQHGDTVLISGNDYPSNFIAFISLQKRCGIRLVTVMHTPTGEIDLNDLEDKLRKHAPKLVSLSHVPTSSGLVQPAAAVGKLVKQYNAWYLLDACQSLGQLPVSARETGADFISGTFRKFLRGPRGAGLLYVSDEVLQAGLEMLMPDIRGAEWATPGTYQVGTDAKRFENWETSYALKAGSREALVYFLDTGLGNILEWNARLGGQLRAGLSGIDGVEVRDRGLQLCNIVTFTLSGIEKEQALAFFHRRRINIYATSRSSAMLDFTEKGIEWVLRASPHYYNTPAEISLFLEAVADLQQAGSR